VAVDIARYQHSPEANQSHCDRLERCARFFANARLVGMCQEEPELLGQVEAKLGTIDWPTRVPIPTIAKPAPGSEDSSTFSLVYVARET